MGDLWAHKHMRKCCKDTLAKLDQIRDAAARAAGQSAAPKGAPTLAGLLGPKKIPEAQLAVHELASSKSPLLEIPASATSARASWTRTINEHAEAHADASEMREAAFWRGFGEPMEPAEVTLPDEAHKKLADRINGKKSAVFGGDDDKEGNELVEKAKAAYGKLGVKPGNKNVMFKVKSTNDKKEFWLGGGVFKTPKFETEYIGVRFDVLKF